jgi:hypothetical protein
LERLEDMLPEYDFVTSLPVGRTKKEIYAFFFKSSIISVLGTPYVYDDSHDDFIREPYIACFKAGNFDFVLINIHVLWGESAAERKEEKKLLDNILLDVLSDSKGEN